MPLHVTGPAHVRIQVFRVGGERFPTRRHGEMDGVAETAPATVPVGAGPVPLKLGPWRTGLYFVRVTGNGIWYAPFVLRAHRTGSRVLVVEPTNTWQAYNNFDGDSWYDGGDETVSLDRPYLDDGVPPHYRNYDVGFLRWLVHTKRRPDFVADADLEHVASAKWLRAHYELVVFPGHEEYVTDHVYDLIERYRDLGGHLMFLSSNNFFYRVVRSGHSLTRTGRWRDIGRPEAALIGAEYVNWNENRYPNRPLEVVGTRTLPWLFAGSGLHDGSRFGTYGIEVDARTPASPPGTKVAATIPNIFGPGVTAEMTYYQTSAGAKVFDAGVMNFGGTAMVPAVSRLLDNLWRRLAAPNA